jgi:hypothetical protein
MIYDDLNGLLGPVLEQLEQWPGVTLHVSTCDQKHNQLERMDEYILLAATVSRSRTFWAKDNPSGLSRGKEYQDMKKKRNGMRGTYLETAESGA